jgi:hypothetical protein
MLAGRETIMRAKLLTLVAFAAMLVGGLTWTDTAEAQRWRGYYGGYYGRYYAAPRFRYYRPFYRGYVGPYYGYGYRYRPYWYGGYRYPRYYSPGVYLGAGPVGVYVR